jgi:hypothetical protein
MKEDRNTLTRPSVDDQTEASTSWSPSETESVSDPADLQLEQKPPGKKKQKLQQRKYDTSYIKWGFTCTEDGLQPFCVICNETLSNQSMKPAFLQRHLNSKHKDLASKLTDFF